MGNTTSSQSTLTVKAYRGDAKTLLAFNLDQRSARNLAGFTIQCQPGGQAPYYIHNDLRFKTPGDHAQDPTESPNSSVNAPIHKFRWVHIPGSVHQGTRPFFGAYTYTVTPRYFDDERHLEPLDSNLSVSVTVQVTPFVKGGLALGFTRGFTQSQAFVHHFGRKALIRPPGKVLLFDTTVESGQNALGQKYTFADEYEWLGFTARQRIFDFLNLVLSNQALRLDMFAYDLNEPDLMAILLKLAKQGRVRIILDNASLHHDAKTPKPEDQFEDEFNKVTKDKPTLLRGRFGRYSHDKVFIISNARGATTVLTGSTNFSVTGLYVNSNHVLVFDDATVAAAYAGVFEQAWTDGVKLAAFQNSKWASQAYPFAGTAIPPMTITFSPHSRAFALKVLDDVALRVKDEGKKSKGTGNVLFAVMQIDNGTSPVYTALKTLHSKQSVFSCGISDSTKGIALYKPGRKTGLLVTGKPASTVLPPPFDQVPGIGAGHQVHHKFVVCGFNTANAVVYCGSSNLANGGEEKNGDNLLAIRDRDVATAFAIEAISLVDHFHFLDKCATGPKGSKKTKPAASQKQAAATAGWFLGTTDAWVRPYFDPKDFHCADRELFG